MSERLNEFLGNGARHRDHKLLTQNRASAVAHRDFQ